MQRIVLPLFLLIVCLSEGFAEIEPNNTADQASVLVLNGSDSGQMNISNDTQDWWKVTTTVNGALIIATLSASTLEIDNNLYDQNKTTLLASYLHGGTQIQDTVLYMHLAPGTYYIRSLCYSGQGSYTITSYFIPAKYEVDTEPNDSAAVATFFKVDTTLTGHLGFTGNGKTDGVDWRMVTIPGDGKLIIATYSDRTIEIDNAIYDGNKVTQLAGYKYGGTHLEDTSEFYNLVAGTYYIRTLDYSGYGSYTITNKFIPAREPNDAEPNDSASVANLFAVNDTATGHLGFVRTGYGDYVDWRKVTSYADGKFVIATYSDATLEIDNSIYDEDKKTQLAGYKYGGTHLEDTSEVLNLGPGTYYVRTLDYSGYGSYRIIQSFTPALLTNDTEPNNGTAQAVTLPFGTRTTGHLGYYQSKVTDTYDYYSITISALDTLFARADNTAGLDIDMKLLNGTGQLVTSATRTGTWELLIAPKIAAGTYTLEVKAYSGFGSYKLVTSSVRPEQQLLAVQPAESQTPTEWALHQNFPNPFNPSTTIRYDLQVHALVSLRVYNILGQCVADLVNQQQSAGSHEVKWSTSLSSGVYFYRMSAVCTSDPNRKFSQMKKMLLVK